MAFLDSCQIHQLSLPEGCSGCVVLDVFEDLILLNGVSLTRPDQLFIGRINYSALNEAVSWKCLSIFRRLLDTFYFVSFEIG